MQEENTMRVREIMSPCFRSIPRNAPIRNAAVRMRDLNVGMLPVEENGEIIGAVTARDITVRGTASGIDPDATAVGDVMSNEIYTCVEDDHLLHAARIMEHHHIRRLMVQNADGEFIGMLTLADVARHLVSEPLCTLILQDVSQPVSAAGARH
jgi:predicted transcriptional regulator